MNCAPQVYKTMKLTSQLDLFTYDDADTEGVIGK